MTEAATTVPPIYFWARVVAAVVDYMLAMVVAVILIWPFLGNPDRLRLDPSGLPTSECSTRHATPKAVHDFIGMIPTISNNLCENWTFGRPNGKTVTAVYGGLYRDGAAMPQTSILIQIDDDGNLVTPLMPQSPLSAILLTLGGGLLVRSTGRTPGKRLMGLKVTGTTPLPGLKREVLKLFPFLLATLATAAAPFLGPNLAGQCAAKPILIATAVAAVWYYLVPLLQWRGATRYDRWLGLTVSSRLDPWT